MKRVKKDPFLVEAELYSEAARLAHRNLERLADLTQFSGGMKLPHPARSALVKNLMVTPLLVHAKPPEIAEYLRMTTTTNDFYQWHRQTSTDYSFSPLIRRTVQQSDQASTGTFMGNSMSYMLSFKSACSKPPVFQIEDRLLSLLDQSDIGEDLTVSHLESLPFDFLYVEMGSTRPLNYGVYNVETGIHRLEGFYVLKSSVPPNPRTGSTLTFVFVGEPKANILDDATQMIMLETGPGFSEKTLSEAIDSALTKSLDTPRATSAAKATLPGAKPLIHELLGLAAKCLLYLNHGKYEKLVQNDLSEYSKAAALMTNPAKRERAIRAGHKLSDKIVILHASYPEGTPSNSDMRGERGVTTHWRRGHFRNQRYGEKLALSKAVWIAPTLVGSDLSGQGVEVVMPKDYTLRHPEI